MENRPVALSTSDFDYELPAELIASRPAAERSASRMMVVDRRDASISHRRFEDFPSLLRSGDLVVLNDTRVEAARFFSDDGRVELLRTRRLGECRWKCMVKPGRRMTAGRAVAIGGVSGVVIEVCADGERIIEFE